MHSLEYYVQISNSPLEKRTFIYKFQSTPSLRRNIITIDLIVCAFQLCDQFSQQQLDEFRPIGSFRSSILSNATTIDRMAIANEIKELFLHGYFSFLSFLFHS